MVGALADWFAVTALFRYPLGIPIPHTAIIPRARTTSAAASATSCRATSSRPTSSASGSRRRGSPSASVGWLAQPANAERAAEATADALGGVVEVLDDRDVQEALGSAVEKRLARTEVAPLLGKAIDVAVEGGHHQRMLDGVMRGLVSFLDDNRTMLRDRLDQESPWWVPGGDRRPRLQQDVHRCRTVPRRRLGDAEPRVSSQHRPAHPGVGDQASRGPGADRQVRVDEAGGARAPRRPGLAAVAVGRGQGVVARGGQRSGERPAPATRPRLRHSRTSPRRRSPSCRPRSTGGSRAWCCTSPSTTGARSPS